MMSLDSSCFSRLFVSTCLFCTALVETQTVDNILWRIGVSKSPIDPILHWLLLQYQKHSNLLWVDKTNVYELPLRLNTH